MNVCVQCIMKEPHAGVGAMLSGGTFGHGGAGGQETFADPDRRLSWTFLTNGELSDDFLLWRYSLQSMALASCRD